MRLESPICRKAHDRAIQTIHQLQQGNHCRAKSFLRPSLLVVMKQSEFDDEGRRVTTAKP